MSTGRLSSADLWNLLAEEETLVIALVDARVLYRRARAALEEGGAEPAGGGGSSGGGSSGGSFRSRSGSAKERSGSFRARGANSPREERRVPSRGASSKDLAALEREEVSREEEAAEAEAVTAQQQRAGEFEGHYVLLVGLDGAREGFVVNDPAREDQRTFVAADALEDARRADGTDEDLLLISVYQPAPVRPGHPLPVRPLPPPAAMLHTAPPARPRAPPPPPPRCRWHPRRSWSRRSCACCVRARRGQPTGRRRGRPTSRRPRPTRCRGYR